MRATWIGTIVAMGIAWASHAQTVPEVINYQGKLMDGTNLFSGTAPITFRLYDTPTGGMFPYCEDSNDVIVVDGLYATLIGDNVTFGSLDNALIQTQVWIEVVIGTNVITPREQLVSVGYARYAAKLPANAVDMSMIASDAIYSWHIADGQVRGHHIQAGAISNVHLADGSISNVKYGFESVDMNALGQNAVQFWHIANNQVRGYHIQAGAISNTHLAAGAVTGVKIADGAVSNSHLAADAVTSNKIDWTTMPDDIEYTAGTGLSIAGGVVSITNGAIGNAQLAANAVTSAKIQDSSILFDDLAQNGAAAGEFVKWSGSSWSPGAADTAASRIPVTNAGTIISQPGSYYLPTNLICIGQTGIHIATNHVTLDLNGFSIMGDGSSHHGISALAGLKYNFTLRNGTITGFGSSGMDASVIYGSHFENITVIGNGGNGMGVGERSLVINCRAIQNGSDGIYASDRSVTRDCVATENGMHGIYMDRAGLVVNCVSTLNSSNGICGGEGTKISGNVASYNDNHGIQVYAIALVKNNECAYNGQTSANGAGIYAIASRNRIEENHVMYNDTGIWAPTSPNFIAKNTAAGNTTEYDVSASSGNRFAPLDTSGDFTNAWANFDF
ncbi:MAG: hypothetical protein EOM20_01495 [Spartobacteria bacterium]|nr:hypothetical protein [Spartobacteria bacterium]